MANTHQLFRLLYIAELLIIKTQGVSYEETKKFLAEKFDERGIKLNFSEKTFKRDRDLIAEMLGVVTQYKKSAGKFTIKNEELEHPSENTLENTLLIETYRRSKKDSQIILFENREPEGKYHFSDFIAAIKGHRVASFQYQKYAEKKSKKRTVIPYALKESQNRWYLLATDFSVGKKYSFESLQSTDEKPTIKSFALDRISNVEIHHTRQLRYTNLIEESFVNSFGVTSTLGETPEEIVLSFSAQQGKYITFLPLHHSQEVLADNENELRIKVVLYPTLDFTHEILSHGANVSVISPESYRKKIANLISAMCENYK